MNTSAFLVNSVFFAFNCYTLYFDYELTLKYAFLPIPGVYLSKLVWLTMVNFFILTIYHGIGALICITQLRNDSKILRAFHFLSTTIVCSASTTVVFLFWFLVFLNPDFLITEEAKPFLSIQWFNHALHTSPVIGMALDFICWRHPRPKKSNALRAIFAFAVLYTIDIHIVYYQSGFWAYPILGQLPLVARSIFIAICVGVFYVAFIVNDTFNSFL